MRRSRKPIGFSLVPLAVCMSLACRRDAPPGDDAAGSQRVEPNDSAEAPARGGGGAWLAGTVDERFELVAKHLRGFDMAMAEVGYRYGELYWASRDRNWGYAEYQLGKIEKAMANGIERRPKRAESARMLEGGVLPVRAAIEQRDPAALDAAMETLRATCNACHRAEQMPFVHVVAPTVRATPIRLDAAAQDEPDGVEEDG